MLAILSLGSNIGNRQLYLKRAKKLLLQYSDLVLETPYMETSAIGPKQRDFINQLILIKTNLAPFTLLLKLKDIERQLGRKKTYHWGPRIIDLDIIVYEREKLNTELLRIPHRELYNRSFILLGLKYLDKTTKQNLYEYFNIEANRDVDNKQVVRFL